jgi:hypothetical protein
LRLWCYARDTVKVIAGTEIGIQVLDIIVEQPRFICQYGIGRHNGNSRTEILRHQEDRDGGYDDRHRNKQPDGFQRFCSRPAISTRLKDEVCIDSENTIYSASGFGRHHYIPVKAFFERDKGLGAFNAFDLLQFIMQYKTELLDVFADDLGKHAVIACGIIQPHDLGDLFEFFGHAVVQGNFFPGRCR